nr:MAG TPA: major capsid protein [Caudoviricetes sp.]
MAVNNLTFNQLATVLNGIVGQATGTGAIAPTNTAEFVSVAQTALKAGYDPVINAVSQVLSKTIFAARPYTRKFRGLEVDNQRYGNIVRKITTIDKPFEDDDRMSLTDGSSVDQYTVNKPEVVQTNFYGANTWQKSMTIFRDQLDSAFSGPDEFSRFISMVMTNADDMIAQAHEATARATIGNFVAGKVTADTTSVIHLLTEYNALTGAEYTATTIYQPANFVPFMRWVASRVNSLCAWLTERTSKYHLNIKDKTVMRHTPKADQRIYMYNPALEQINTMVKSNTFNDQYLNIAYTEGVNYWQAVNTPDQIQATPVYLNVADGTLTTAEEAVTVDKVFGVIADRDAMGYTIVNQWSSPTPFNAKGGYSNVFWHFTDRYWNDFMENGIILLLD